LNAKRIHIFGASGGGVSTLGRALAQRIDARYFESDDIYWQATDPPYRTARVVDERQRLLRDAIAHERWIIAGSLCGWGDLIIPHIDVAVFVTTPTSLRLERLRQRERQRFGKRIERGGDMHDEHKAFIEWAARYDDGTSDMRSRPMHEAWIARLPCQVIRLDGARPIEELVAECLEVL
jgi:adenylate kinase family enzyme